MTSEGRRHGDLRAKQPKAIRSALAVLEVVARRGPGTTAKDICDELSMPRATTYRIVNLLEQEEYLIRLPDLRGFALGRKVREMTGPTVMTRMPRAVRDELASLRRTVRAGIHVFRLEQQHIAALDEDEDFPMPAQLRTGRPTGLDPVGLLVLHSIAGSPPAKDRLAAGIAEAGIPPSTAMWERVSTLGAAGFAVSTGQPAGCDGIAIPIYGPNNELEAGLVALFPRGLPPQHEDILGTLREAGQRLTPLLT